MPTLAGYGVRAFGLTDDGPASDPRSGADSSLAQRSPFVPVRAHDGRLDNGLLRVGVDARGRVSLHDLVRDVVLDDLIGFEDVGDAGDLYTHSPIGHVLTTVRCAGTQTIDRGPLRATLEARYGLRVPESLAADPDDRFSRPTRRASRAIDVPLTIRLTLDAGAPFVRIRITGNNRARDHRLRVVFRTGSAVAPRDADGAESSDAAVADAAFGPVDRRPIVVSAAEAAVERPPTTAPLHRYVSRAGPDHGVTVYSDGLAEYEAMPDGAIAVTLVRGVGQLSRPDLPERPGHAGWPAATPEAQGSGEFRAHFALAIHAPDSDETRAHVEALADDVLLPLVGETTRAALHSLESPASIQLEGFGFGTVRSSRPSAGTDGSRSAR